MIKPSSNINVQETDRLLGQQYTEADPSYYNKVGIEAIIFVVAELMRKNT